MDSRHTNVTKPFFGSSGVTTSGKTMRKVRSMYPSCLICKGDCMCPRLDLRSARRYDMIKQKAVLYAWAKLLCDGMVPIELR